MIRSMRAGLAVLVVSATAAAEPTRNIDLTVFDPTPTTSGSSFQLQTADIGASGDYVASAFASYASRPLVLVTDTAEMIVVRHHTMLSVGGAYAFGGRFEAGARLPLYIQSGDPVPDGMTGVEPASGTAIGDVTLHAKARLVGRSALRIAAGLSLTVPTASDDQFAGTELPTGRVLVLASLAATRALTLHANAGGIVRKRAQFANFEHRSGATWGVGVSYRAFERVFFDVEAFGDAVPSGTFGRPTTDNVMGASSTLMTFEALAGARIQLTDPLSLGIAAGTGLVNGPGAPKLRGVLSLAYVPGARPLPPLRRPAPVEVVDKSELDTDFDRINDAVDKCPDDPEDLDGFEDDDGCPDLDNDKDGIPDADDKCPNEPEDKDGFEDADGCPDPDNDKDGIPDDEDKCPNEPEKINGNEDDDGCPDAGNSLVISNPDRLELLEAVVFNGDNVAKASANVLGQLARTLRARADILRVRITVHVQPTRNAKRDQDLSDRRAAAVKAWLVEAGVAEQRIDARGFGSTKPLVPVGSKGSAAINNRVELIILERE